LNGLQVHRHLVQLDDDIGLSPLGGRGTLLEI